MRIGSAIAIVVWVSALGVGGYVLYQVSESRRTEERLRASVARLTDRERVARILVEAIDPDGETGHAVTRLRWIEEHPSGTGGPPRTLTLEGDRVRFEALQIVFDDGLVTDGDPLRGKSLHLFRLAYGQHQAPEEGVRLDVPPGGVATAGEAPDAEVVPPWWRSDPARVHPVEARLWRDFWRLATDQEAARKEGVATAQGVSVWKPLVAGKEYRLTLSAQGQLRLEGPFEPDPLLMPEK